MGVYRLGADACKVVFELNYEFANSLLSMMAGKWMGSGCQ